MSDKEEVWKKSLKVAHDALSGLHVEDTGEEIQDGIKTILLAFDAVSKFTSHLNDGIKDYEEYVFIPEHSIVASAVFARLFDWDIDDTSPINSMASVLIMFASACKAMELASELESVFDGEPHGTHAAHIAIKVGSTKKST